MTHCKGLEGLPYF